MKMASAGTLSSNDCMITVRLHHEKTIKIRSIVIKQFGDQIKKVIEDTLEELKIDHIYVDVDDKGALDYTIKSRLITAIKRLGETDA